MYDDRRACDLWSVIVICKPLLNERCKGPHTVSEEFLHRQKGRHKDHAREAEERRQRDCRPCADGPTKHLDAVKRPPQRVCRESDSRKCILHDSLTTWGSRADAITWIFDCKNVDLELITDVAAETMASAKILSIAVKEYDEESCRRIRQQEARHAFLEERWCANRIIPLVRILRHPDEVKWKTVNIVTGWWHREQDAGDKAALQHAYAPLDAY
mmetsp:Transcript_137074/g.249955  ORF Transcript_137074/g.249955 Transcript_137074/m.249955 type:complete len:214 (-) Transcript_137074:128-769(-)